MPYENTSIISGPENLRQTAKKQTANDKRQQRNLQENKIH